MGAQPSGTFRYFASRKSTYAPREFGRTGWAVSPVGFGGYRIDLRHPAHSEALQYALLNWCNLIDTSANYADGESERLIGKVLASLFNRRELEREEIILVTKAGYIQGANLKTARKRAAEGRPFEDVVQYSPDCWHCIHPDFLENQISSSLERLGVECLDVLLLHNPEYFLKAGGDHAEYYDRIQQAFEYLESEVKRGRIQHYGVSSNTFVESRESPEFTSLEVILEIAKGLGDDHRFSVIQFPLNLFEPGAVLDQNNLGGTVLQLALQNGLGTLSNRPLNAFLEGELVRLADFSNHSADSQNTEGSESPAQRLQRDFLPALELESRYPAGELLQLNQVAWAHILKQNLSRIQDPEVWRQLLEHQIEPSLEKNYALLQGDEAFADWAVDHRQALKTLLKSVGALLDSQASLRSEKISAQLNSLCPALSGSTSLSRKATRVYRSLPGLSCVLAGMRKKSYVKDLLADPQPNLSADQAIDLLNHLQHQEHPRVDPALSPG